MSIHRALPLNCSMFKFNCSDSFLEDLPKTGLMTILSSWPFFSVSRKPMLILSVTLELNLLPLLDNTITGNVNFPSIHALILWLKHTLWTATAVFFLFVLFVFSAIYSCIFQTKPLNVEAWGLVVKERGGLILVHLFCFSVCTSLLSFWSDGK